MLYSCHLNAEISTNIMVFKQPGGLRSGPLPMYTYLSKMQKVRWSNASLVISPRSDQHLAASERKLTTNPSVASPDSNLAVVSATTCFGG